MQTLWSDAVTSQFKRRTKAPSHKGRWTSADARALMQSRSSRDEGLCRAAVFAVERGYVRD
jgi:hypothetical protein